MASPSQLLLSQVIQARDQTSAALARLRGSLDSVRASASGAGGSISQAFSGLQAKITAAVSALGALGVAWDGKKAIAAAGDYEALKLQLQGITGSAQAAEQVIREINAAFSPAQLKDATAAYVQLAAFGIRPSTKDLQSLLDANAKTGKGMNNLNGIIAQMGQAWSKQKLQYEDILVLMERGIPVWDLLAKATGYSTQALAEMASAGQLGRREIALLVETMGQQSAGATQLAASGWNGLVASFKALAETIQRRSWRAGYSKRPRPNWMRSIRCWPTRCSRVRPSAGENRSARR